MTEPNSALKKFHSLYCADKSIDSVEVFNKLLEKWNDLNKKED